MLLHSSSCATGLVRADEVVPAQLDLSNAVLLGWQDYTVRSIDAVLGHEKWNVTYAQLDVLTPQHLAVPASMNPEHLLPPSAPEAVHAGTSCGTASCCLSACLPCDASCSWACKVCRPKDFCSIGSL